MRDYNGTAYRLGREALTAGEAAPILRAQLRSHVLAEQISIDGATAAYTYDVRELRRGLALARMGQLTRTPRERRADPGPLRAIAQAYADLAERYETADPQRVELLAIAATTWSLAGYQANSAALAASFRSEVRQYFAQGESQVIESETTSAPYRIAELTGAVLQRDIGDVARLGARAQNELPRLGQQLMAAAADGLADQSDAAVLAAYGLTGRAARSLAALWRLGDRAAGRAAIADLRKASSILLDASVVDTWTLTDSLAYVVEDIVATSPWLLLRRAVTWSRLWERYLKALIIADRPMTQVWPSQRKALDAGLVDTPARNLAVTMPTSAGKTHIAEWAILHALAPQPGEHDTWWLQPRLAVYVVPTRALAAQVERHLAESLELVGLRVSALFGGVEHVRYETQLLDFTNVLVITSEKLDLLLRNVPELAQRLALVLVDEGHNLDASERGLRLEMLLTRIRRDTPTARIVLLSAVLPNGEALARWLDPTADGTNHANIRWTPSQLRTGVFYWRGLGGTIEYGTQGRRDFFVSQVLTRHRKVKRLFPSDPKDVAAALALHFDRLGPVLVASPTRGGAHAAAKALGAALRGTDAATLGAHENGSVTLEILTRRLELSAEIARHTGDGHDLTLMVLGGYAYHHAGVPQAVRHSLERAYREGTLRVLCATSTLSQGMNLPTKTVIIPSTWRNRKQISVRDFWNTAGRAGRAFRETEGHVILIAEDQRKANELRRRYLDRNKIEAVRSTLAQLYVDLVRARLGGNPQQGHDITTLDLADPEDGNSVAWAEGLDIQLLALLAEEAVDSPDQHLLEQAAHTLLSHTLGAHQLGAYNWPLEPLARFSTRRVKSIATRLPDRAVRAGIVRTGLSVQGGIDALTAADHIHATINTRPELLTTDHWPELQQLILTAATEVQELQRSATKNKIPVDAIAPTAIDWIAGAPLKDLHRDHKDDLQTDDITATTTITDNVIAHDLAWVVSALFQLLELRRDVPAEGTMATLPAMIKYGVDSPTACYASSIGIHDRTAAIALASHCPYPEPTFGAFLDWLSQLDSDDLTAITTPDIAALLIRSSERRSPRAAQATILRGRGTLTCHLRGVRHARSIDRLVRMPIGTPLTLLRDRGNATDPNAIRVEHEGVLLGWVAREIAQPLAIVLDDTPPPDVTAYLGTDTRRLVQESGTVDQIGTLNTIQLTITLIPV
ncbi:DEAD/DEAH box helicase [Streptomyces sp. NPDC002680]|uniref:DEAD/DEAH box helicase n=1 Tax=Streptomyces sp. NPDC002680 TaxID=3364659 RepID=UPI0036CFBE23